MVDSSKFAHAYDPATQLVVCHKLAPATQTLKRSSKNHGKLNFDFPSTLWRPNAFSTIKRALGSYYGGSVPLAGPSQE